MEYDDHVEGNDHKDDEDGDDDEPVGAPSAGQFTVCAADLDSCIVPMKTGKLERLFPSLQMAALVNHLVFIKLAGCNMCCRIWLQIIYNSHKPED